MSLTRPSFKIHRTTTHNQPQVHVVVCHASLAPVACNFEGAIRVPDCGLSPLSPSSRGLLIPALLQVQEKKHTHLVQTNGWGRNSSMRKKTRQLVMEPGLGASFLGVLLAHYYRECGGA